MTKFDPATHRFGHAYMDKEGRIIYPTRLDEVTLRALVEPFKPWPQYHDFWVADVTRAESHDLIPASEVNERLKLAEDALRFYTDRQIYDKDHTGNHWLHDFGHRARKYFREESE